MNPDLIAEAERTLLERLEQDRAASPAPIFILGAPRTGSTLLYQMITAAFGCAYFSNLVNQFFPQAPVLGLTVQKVLAARDSIDFHSRFGKTEGLFQPSEASAVMRDWFGGEHPSQSRSAGFIPGRARIALATCRAAESLFGRPLVIKNAWNCFRIEATAGALPQARFIWIRRDLRAAAKSDLHARYAVQGSPLAWNSATPANVERLRERPYVEQVVENQYEFSAAIGAALARLTPDRHTEVWYEDLCRRPAATLSALEMALPDLPLARTQLIAGATAEPATSWELNAADSGGIDAYIETQGARLAPLLRAPLP